MDCAVIRVLGKQYLVSSGDEIVINGHVGGVGEKVDNVEVLLSVNDGKVSIGTPVLVEEKLRAEIIKVGKGKKVMVVKFKAKSRYRRKIGFRPLESVVKID